MSMARSTAPVVALVSTSTDAIGETNYRETKHFLFTRDFLNSPDIFFKHLFGTVEDDVGDA